MSDFEIIVIGAGPAGSTCAALTAATGRNVLLLEASRFPRDKVCGDCLNPAVWHVLKSLDVADRVRELPCTYPRRVRFSVAGAGSAEIPLSETQESSPEMVVRRRDFDELLAKRAVESGVLVRDGTPVTNIKKITTGWEVTTATGEIHRAKQIVAADGRNSVTARFLGFHPPLKKGGRIGIQIHIPHPEGYDGALEMRIYRHGYGGLADLGNGLANLCLVANEGEMKELRKEAEGHYGLDPAGAWRSITPITRSRARSVARDGVFLCGDAAQVVEPFTGEGISFALRSGALLADLLTDPDNNSPSLEKRYEHAHRRLYSKGLWVNRLTRLFSEHPRIAHAAAPLLLRFPELLSTLTSKVITSS
jgi:geranylgeranyl reductase family protein